jgi:prepilin-type N-terminal cleavage/methylation domain-containing protein
MVGTLRSVRARNPRKGGFTLIELLVVIAIIALLIGILLPALAEARRLARLSICQSDEAQHGKGQGSYAADFEDRTYSFTWRRGHTESTFADLRAQAMGGPDTAAAAAQAVDIFRRRAGRTDIAPIALWIPHVLYTHLVLQDYWASRLPEKVVVCPEDRFRLDWQQDNGKLFDSGFWLPFQPAQSAINKRWPYSSSYHTVPATYDVNQSRDVNMTSGLTVSNRLYQGGNDSGQYTIPGNANLGGTRLADVAFPGQKVQLYDEQARHFGEWRWYGYTDAKAPLLFFDGSVRVIQTSETNSGWNPNAPAQNVDTHVRYQPDLWESPVRGGSSPLPPPNGFENLPTWYRWTRGGLKGVDVGGNAIPAGL